MDDYAAFLKSKVRFAGSWGFEIDEAEINPKLKPHQRATVQWMVAGGRRGIGFELSHAYFVDGAAYCRAAAEEMAMPSLFDLTSVEVAQK
jgi:hypothetical protein